MEPYQKNLLEQILKSTEENNKILKSLRNHSRWGIFFGFLKWAIIIGPVILAYIYFQPYLGTIKDMYLKLPEQMKTIQSINEQFEGAKDFFQNPPKIPR